MERASGAARMESQTPGVQCPTVTRPADNTDALLLPAPRKCVCGHPVYDAAGSACLLCACRDHRSRGADTMTITQHLLSGIYKLPLLTGSPATAVSPSAPAPSTTP
jgi:hypothetical protein